MCVAAAAAALPPAPCPLPTSHLPELHARLLSAAIPRTAGELFAMCGLFCEVPLARVCCSPTEPPCLCGLLVCVWVARTAQARNQSHLLHLHLADHLPRRSVCTVFRHCVASLTMVSDAHCSVVMGASVVAATATSVSEIAATTINETHLHRHPLQSGSSQQ